MHLLALGLLTIFHLWKLVESLFSVRHVHRYTLHLSAQSSAASVFLSAVWTHVHYYTTRAQLRELERRVTLHTAPLITELALKSVFHFEYVMTSSRSSLAHARCSVTDCTCCLAPSPPPPPRVRDVDSRTHTQASQRSWEWRPTEAVLLLQHRRCRAPSRRNRGTISLCARRTGACGSGTRTRARYTGNTCLPRTSALLVLASPGDHAERPRYTRGRPYP